MRVLATAGHVDHGKSTLVRALTGTDPDRWDEEHRRGLTIDLGYVWTRLPDDCGGHQVVFVDVPGHQRFIANMLAGIGPAPAVLFVVAADEGWCRQSSEHLAAVRALGIEHGLLVVTRSDLADPAPALAQAREHLAGTALADCEAVCVSATTGQGMDELRAALGRLCASLPEPTTDGRLRLWIDRVFTIRGAGTVVTGTLERGTLHLEDNVQLHTEQGPLTASVRGLQSLETPHDQVPAVARVAVNLRGVTRSQVARGDALLQGPWRPSASVDARLDSPADGLPERLMAHLGTSSLPVRLRPLDDRVVRLTWPRELPLQVGDRLVLRDPGQQHVVAGAVVLDVDPPALQRRGAARRRGAELAGAEATVDLSRELARRGWMRRTDLLELGVEPVVIDSPGPGTRVSLGGELLVGEQQWTSWVSELAATIDHVIAANPLQARLPLATAMTTLGLPDRALLEPLANEAGLLIRDGHLEKPGRTADLGPAEAALTELEAHLAEHPFDPPGRDALARRGLGANQIAAAVRLGRLVDLGNQVVLLPLGPAMAMRELASLPQPFTTSQARQALNSSRRVVIPLLEDLDAKGWTRRIDAGHREVVRRRD
ncbi:selenocysteine-specific translation elongation factor [Luteococcus sp. Sow4_B9]|uniref:selenocysteine-specific translation elongation factor n=1 Tax=Luteococcus sp. Sow4_B9 TaxID=3438792 RepID=UPI003F9A0937